MTDSHTIRLLCQTMGDSEGIFRLGEPPDEDGVTLSLHYPGGEIIIQASDYFEAMCQVRTRLEAEGRYPVCYGSSRNVYPSGMCRSMGSGLKAYKTSLGRRAMFSDLVNIFDTGPDVEPSSVEEQQLFHQKWLRSLGIQV